ncbi:MAG: cation-translocating P-type ATPase [Pseudomonadota bacterium]|nr:cation-translocating P-type ATPase [Pseudomonadota bacterium]
MGSETVGGTAPADWHTVAPDEALRRLGTARESGLDVAEVERRGARWGPNALAEGRRRGPLRMLLDQFTDFMVIVLVAAAVLAGILGEPEDTVAIAVIVVLNAVLGFVQEYRAERAMSALKGLASPHAQVRRGGQVVTVASEALVPGDVVMLEAGNMLPADLRLVESAQLRIEEAALTGESLPVEKIVDALPAGDLPLGDRRNMGFKGTLVSHGRGVGVVVATGMRTELGRIATLLHEEDAGKTPLQHRLARFGQRLALAVIGLCATLFVVGLLRGEEPLLMFLTALSLAVAAIPEALPAVVTVALALGARKMVAHSALIRRLPAVETLGSVTYICSDKTGTLTENRMRMEPLRAGEGDAPESEPRRSLFEALAHCNDAARGADGAIRGEPTEVALLEAAEREGVSASLPRLDEVPFSSERARMSTLHPRDGAVVVFTKGAPERVLEVCSARQGPTSTGPLDLPAVLAEAEDMARQGLRVLAVATRTLQERPGETTAETIETDLVFLGLVGLLDPPRPEAAEAVRMCQTAGIRAVMITGDHPATAGAIARKLGIAQDGAVVLTGPDLQRLSDERFQEVVEHVRVYARVAPEQKIRIVKALQARGEFVAMTGDGVNDAPALRRADIGVAMGRGGTDVAREAAHMVLLDDNFATIVSAVREGRRIYDNIRKFIRYALTGNAGEIWALVLAPMVMLPIPLLPIHILWVNLVTDGLPGLALSVEPAERGIMERPPRPPGESIFAHGLWQHAVWVGLLIGGLTLGVQAWAWHTGHAHWQSMTFTTLTLAQMAHVLAIRSERESFFAQGPFSNLPLLGAVGLTFALQMATLYLPFLNPIFETEPLTAAELAICIAASTVVFLGVELEKWAMRKGWSYGENGGRS